MSFCLRTLGSREHPVSNAASKQAATTAQRNPAPLAIPISPTTSHRANFVVSTLYCTKVLFGLNPEKLLLVLSQTLPSASTKCVRYWKPGTMYLSLIHISEPTR